MKRTTIIETLIFLYAILFIYTGINKLIDYSTFKEQLSDSPVIGSAAPFVAAVLPWTEFLVVLLLILPKWRLKGFYSSLALMIAFTSYVIILLSISDKLPCSCGGIISLLSWPQHIVFNCAYIIMGIIGIILQRQQKKENLKNWRSFISQDTAALTK